MRPIPPQIWACAVGLGHAQALLKEVSNPHAIMAAALMAQKIERFLEHTRKEKRK